MTKGLQKLLAKKGDDEAHHRERNLNRLQKKLH